MRETGTFAAWLPDAKDLKDVEARRLQARHQALQQEKKSPVSPERQKEIDAELPIALLWRHGIALKPLRVLSRDKEFAWLRDKDGYWRKSMLSAS